MGVRTGCGGTVVFEFTFFIPYLVLFVSELSAHFLHAEGPWVVEARRAGLNGRL